MTSPFQLRGHMMSQGSSMPSVVRPTTGLSMPNSAYSKTRTRMTSRSTARSRADTGVPESTYEWHDLPPILKMKDAITRKQVCSGINYVLPIDKGKNSVENVYRTNLRVVFQEPYIKESDSFDEMKLRASAEHHFTTNNPPAPYTPYRGLSDYAQYRVNSDSAKVRKQYNETAPTSGITGRQTTADSGSLQKRSELILPMKTNVPPEAVKLKKEAEKIIQSVQEEYDESTATDDVRSRMLSRQPSNISGPSNILSKKLRRPSHLEREISASILERQNSKKRAGLYKTYNDCKDSYKLIQRDMPKDLESPYMERRKADDVWQWLNTHEQNTDFSHFMGICS